METNVLTIVLAMLGSSVITAIVTAVGRRKTDQAEINSTLLENARLDITQIRQENTTLRTRIDGLEKRINTLKTDIEEREILIRIAEKENQALKEKVEGLEKELCQKNIEIVALEGRIKELEDKLKAGSW